ncbi:hypothetical protein DNH61_04130 [Paenibacillus sambharensis]|uniref:Uncharacterized protein n=1 Tax=Paenibacillus sambharensis TaxID=1803190 RepID=A0A2W1M031_9BACL|nr:hypothetical protein [Paenibacillus sambharensis]PZD97087.1 hypothetical protein DNH61_04130 [Paenibacillus sambharensis]
MKIKRWIAVIGSLVIIIGAAWIIYVKLALNFSVDTELAGVKYQLEVAGEESEPAAVVIQGKLLTSLIGERVFKGIVQVAGEQIPVPEDQRRIEIHFTKDGWGAIMYPYFIYDEHTGAVKDAKVYQSHSIFASKDFSQVTLLLSSPVQQADYEVGTSQSVWNAENGMMLSAPASTRQEALAISNKLMQDFLRGKTLR